LDWHREEDRPPRFRGSARGEACEADGDFKAKAATVTRPVEMWDVEEYLREQRQEIDQIFDYRYSQLLLVFGRLIRSGELNERRLSGLSEEKLEIVRRIASRQ
jgi:hypothetical protein